MRENETVSSPTTVPVYFYSSVSNLTRRFAEALEQHGWVVRDLSDAQVRHSETSGPWVLLTPSYKAGNDANVTLPAAVRSFLRSPVNRRHLVGIVGSGNRNFGEYYQAAARELSRTSRRPILFEFELSGTVEDVDACVRILRDLDEAFANRQRGDSET